MYLAGILMTFQIGTWAFAPSPKPPAKPLVGTSKERPEDSTTEKYSIEGRDSKRSDGLRALEMPISQICSKAGRKSFVSGLSSYYEYRQNQLERYPEIYGAAGDAYIVKQWKAPDDSRIERLTQELFTRGYLKPEEFSAMPRRLIDTIISQERVRGGGCEV